MTKIGHEIGLISDERYAYLWEKEKIITSEVERLEHTNIGAAQEVQDLLVKYESTPLNSGTTLAELIRRPELSYEVLEPIDKRRNIMKLCSENLSLIHI